MDIFSVFTLCGGLAFFLYGMNMLSSGLEKMAGGKLESLLKKTTSNPLMGLLLGVIITVAIQSSSAVTVMLVGLVNSGIMQLGQTIAVIMGSNIGTTLTAWLLSLSGIESDNVWINLLKPESFAPLLAFIGILFIMISKTDKKKSIGAIFIGFAILMYGMEMMKNAVAPLAEVPEFESILTMFENPILGVLVGAIFTGVIQSSAASVGVLQALSLNGSITFSMAIPIIMGQNIGTCVTALLSSIGVNRNARRVSVIHISFNLIGTAFFLTVYCILNSFVEFGFSNLPITPFYIAIVHSIFNVATVLLLFPFNKQLEKLAYLIIKENALGTPADEVYSFVDDRLLPTPSVAISECNSKCKKMAKLARDTIFSSIELIDNYTEKTAELVFENEDLLDLYEDKLGTYLVKLSGKEVSDIDSRRVSLQLHTIGDFERIGDHAVNIMDVAKEMHEKKLHFSDHAKKETEILISALSEILDITTNAYVSHDINLAKQVEPLEEVIDNLIIDIKSNHIQRLKEGKCTIELGFILSDLLTNCERVSDHCSNVAVTLIETDQYSMDAHEYLNVVKRTGNKDFESKYEMYNEKYSLKTVE
ncbi:MAG: Na/Pi cotransporter family protein [Lachnospiraceae bacterium]|nr:Na/Pi cotransporter family protein [Lachnospiraceae bacterium]